MTSSSSTGSFIKFTPISGARQDPQTPVCYLLEIDQTRLLLDCGSTPSLDVAHLHALKRIVAKQKIDAVLVSHASLKYIGGLPWVYGVLGLTCPILATLPVHHLGLVSLYDAYQSTMMTTGEAPPEISLDHIDRSFEHITLLRFAQTFYLTTDSIMISALPAGHTVGGAIWRIKKGDETIVYAPAFNHKRETHLDGAPFELLSRPTLLITGTDQSLKPSVPRKTRDDSLFEAINVTLKSGGNVLLPVDTASRSLELIQLLEMYWSSNKRSEPLVLLSHQSKRTVELAKGMLEWMGQSMMKTFETDRSNPFDLRCFKLCHSLSELKDLPEPKVVLASLDSLDSGFSRALFTAWSGQSKSLVLLTSSPPVGSLAHRLLSENVDSKKAATFKLTVRIFENVPLEGEELRAHLRAAEEAKEREAAEAAFSELKRRKLAEEDADLDELMMMEESEDQPNNKLPLVISEMDKISSAKALREIYWTDYRHDWYDDHRLALDPEALDYPLLLDMDRRHQVFPFQFYRKRTGDYGVPVDPADFTKNEVTAQESSTASGEQKRPSSGPLVSVEEKPVVPTKLIDYTKEISIRCKRSMVDFSGLVDGRSLRTIIAQIDPRRMILVGGPDEPTDYLLNHALFRSDPLDPDFKHDTASAPGLLETVRISMAANTKQIILSQPVIDQLDISLYKDVELAYVQARIEYRSEGQEKQTMADDVDMEPSRENPEEDEESSKTLVLEPLADSAGGRPTRLPMLIGDLKLNELRAKILGQLSIPAEFVRGDLVLADGRIRIRKEDERSLILEGATVDAYYQVRDLIYSELAII